MRSTIVETETVPTVKHAPRWRVILHDDPLTPFVFVVDVVRRVFAKSAGEALRVTQEAQDTGLALVDILPLEQAEFRRDQVHSLARPHGYPLTVSLEPAD